MLRSSLAMQRATLLSLGGGITAEALGQPQSLQLSSSDTVSWVGLVLEEGRSSNQLRDCIPGFKTRVRPRGKSVPAPHNFLMTLSSSAAPLPSPLLALALDECCQLVHHAGMLGRSRTDKAVHDAKRRETSLIALPAPSHRVPADSSRQPSHEGYDTEPQQIQLSFIPVAPLHGSLASALFTTPRRTGAHGRSPCSHVRDCHLLWKSTPSDDIHFFTEDCLRCC